MLSRSPSPTSLFQDTTMDDGFMVVPVWEPMAEVQIGSVVLEDPFLGFGPSSHRHSSALLSPVKDAAFAVATADAAFVDAEPQPPPPPPPPPQPQPLAHPQPPPPQPQSHCFFHNQQPSSFPQAQSQPVPASQQSPALAEVSPSSGLGWWEESGPVSALESLEPTGPPPDTNNSVDAFLGFPQQAEVTIEATGPPPPEPTEPPLRSPEDILNEIYAEAQQLESEGSEGSPGTERDGDWWTEAESTEGSEVAPSPLDAAFDEGFRSDLLSSLGSDTSSPCPSGRRGGRAVLSLDAGSLPTEALRSGGQLNLVLHIKDPVASRKRGPKYRATVSIAPAPPAKKKRSSSSASAKGPRAKRGEAKERKKAQNRVAATKYREKKRSAREDLLKALEEQEERQARLKRAEEDAVNEITYLRDLLKKVQTKKDQEITVTI